MDYPWGVAAPGLGHCLESLSKAEAGSEQSLCGFIRDSDKWPSVYCGAGTIYPHFMGFLVPVKPYRVQMLEVGYMLTRQQSGSSHLLENKGKRSESSGRKATDPSLIFRRVAGLLRC